MPMSAEISGASNFICKLSKTFALWSMPSRCPNLASVRQSHLTANDRCECPASSKRQLRPTDTDERLAPCGLEFELVLVLLPLLLLDTRANAPCDCATLSLCVCKLPTQIIASEYLDYVRLASSEVFCVELWFGWASVNSTRVLQTV